MQPNFWSFNVELTDDSVKNILEALSENVLL